MIADAVRRPAPRRMRTAGAFPRRDFIRQPDTWPIVVGSDIPLLVIGEKFGQRARFALLLRRRRRDIDEAEGAPRLRRKLSRSSSQRGLVRGTSKCARAHRKHCLAAKRWRNAPLDERGVSPGSWVEKRPLHPLPEREGAHLSD
jgi:hypothetical protein